MGGNIVVISSAALPAVQSVDGQTGNIQLQISGDVSSPLGSLISTLATVNANVGGFGDAAHTVTITLDGKGRATAAASNAIAIAASQITSGTFAAGLMPAFTGDVTNSAGSLATTVGKINGVALGSTAATAGNLLVGSGSQWVSVAASGDLTVASSGAHTLATVNTNTGSWGTSSSVATLTINGKGLVTAASNTTIAIAGSQITSGSINSIPVGSTTASTGAFTTLSASSTVSGTGFSTYLASPPAIGGTAAAAGSFTALAASSTVSGAGFSNYLASPPAIGGTTAAAGSFTTLSATGNFTPSQTNGIVGTTTNNSANAGSVGEYVSATASAVALTSNTPANATSISLTAGDWDVSGGLLLQTASALITNGTAGTSSTSATFGAAGTYFQYQGSAVQSLSNALPTVRYSLSATTTIYLVADAVFASGSTTASGIIRARRVR